MPEESDYKCMCTTGNGNCLLYHAVLEMEMIIMHFGKQHRPLDMHVPCILHGSYYIVKI